MARSTTALVPPGELAALFQALDLWLKIKEGTLVTNVHTAKSAPSKSFAGATSQILRHYNTAGAHACTTHQIIDQTGTVLHWDEADIKVGVVTIAKSSSRSQVGPSTGYQVFDATD